MKKIHSDKKFVCLALQGGGSFGAYTWGILEKILADDRLVIDAISATSAGSVNAIILAEGMRKGGREGAIHALHDFWKTLSLYGSFISPVRQFFPNLINSFSGDYSAQFSFAMFDLITRVFSPYILNPFDIDILRYLLTTKVDFEALKKYEDIKLFLSATNVRTGRLKVFENKDITVDVVLASACLPHLSKAVAIEDDYYWDGGFLGNPVIFPLIYNSQIDDILIIHNNPIKRDTVPISSSDIANRCNEISFNSSLIRELRVIAFITNLLREGFIKEEMKEKLKLKNMHIIRSDEIMDQFNLINKYNWHWDFLSHLHVLGKEKSTSWLKDNFIHLGNESTIDFEEFM